MAEHTWRAISHGRSSLISPDQWNVSALTEEDFQMELDVLPEAATNVECLFFCKRICALTTIASEVLQTFQ